MKFQSLHYFMGIKTIKTVENSGTVPVWRPAMGGWPKGCGAST
jgi:hypothetical protein